jgi:hypothetical protein
MFKHVVAFKPNSPGPAGRKKLARAPGQSQTRPIDGSIRPAKQICMGDQMRGSFVASVAAAILFLTACPDARAQLPSLGDDTSSSDTAKGVITEAPSPEQIVELVKKADGFSEVQVVTDKDDKNKKWVTAKATSVPQEGKSVTFAIVPVVCKESKCSALWYYTHFGKAKNIDLKWINAWIGHYYFGRPFIDSQGNFSFDMTVYFFGGTAPDYVASSAVVFRSMLQTLFSFKPDK